MSKKSSIPLTVQTVVLAAIVWSVIALLFFLLFSVSSTGQERPAWYSIMTYLFEQVAFLAAGLLCFRNWRSSQIVSGGTVWLAIGLGMISYFIGNLLLGYWEIGLGKSPDISPGDLFYVLTYVFLGWGMLRALIARRLNLTPIQRVILAAITIAGIALAVVFAPVSEEAAPEATAPAIEQTAPASPAASPTGIAPSPSPSSAEVETSGPAWATTVEDQMAPLSGVVSWLYVIGDVILVVMASALLLAFWGGRFSLSWRSIAAAALSFYIADIWFNYAVNYIPGYQTGALPEVFWVFSGCLFAIGAVLEYDLSTRRQTRRRRS